ncbi:MAG: PTS sugar transporter subunit IIA [Planctomycetes bacterium]|nr:PTS sugar transporter subunit IIA [Planctomycetota bacterium]
MAEKPLDKELMNVREAAHFLDVSEKTVYRWASAGTVPHSRAGDQYRFSREDLIIWAQATGRKISPELIQEPEIKKEDLPTLYQAIQNGGVYYQVDGSTPSEVIEEAVSIIRLPRHVDREYISGALLARESLASTGIGHGIAIPHMRNSLVEIGEPQVSLCILAKPVDWHSVDGEPVDIVFIPCCPNMRTHLHLLSRISYAVSQNEWRDLLAARAVRKELISTLAKLEESFFK